MSTSTGSVTGDHLSGRLRLVRKGRQPARSRAAGGLTIAVAIGVMNVATYVSTVLAARLLGPGAYGGFAAVLGLLLVVGVLMLGLQTTGARRVAASPGDVGEIERALMWVTYRAAWVLAGVCLLLTPVFDSALHLQSTVTAALVALVVWPMTTVGGATGILQGERRWFPLAAVYLSMGLARLAGTLLLVWWPTEAVAALSMAIGFAAPALVGWWLLRRFAHLRSPHASGHHDAAAILRELGSNSHALLAFFALSNADVILSRFVLDPHSSGLYAGGLIVVKSLLFLPQFVIVLAFPSMATEVARRATLARERGRHLRPRRPRHRRRCGHSSDVALVFVGGQQYADIQDQLWLFAVLGHRALGGPAARLQRAWPGSRDARCTCVWAALVVLAVGGQDRPTPSTELVVTVTVVDAALMVVLLVRQLVAVAPGRPRGRPRTARGSSSA